VGAEVDTTSLGLRLSGGPVADDSGLHHHYAFSHAEGPLGFRTARRLAALVVRLHHPGAAWDLVHGGRGVYHVVVHPVADPVAATPSPVPAPVPAPAEARPA
ncbi:MAG TPA: hypothetical protein VFO65_05720, partial [Acidimicrobiales bacterium]|nr:hypothetical protein [Acidimicrobiales bacterium]